MVRMSHNKGTRLSVENERPAGSIDVMASRQGLNQRAQTALQQRLKLSPEAISAMPPTAAQQALHELQVHQLELEMQNEELRRIQSELDSAHARYFDFYDLAPVGFCMVNLSGLFLQANLAAAALLGVERGALPGQAMSRFIHADDQSAFHRLRQAIAATHEAQDCEFRLVKQTGAPIWVHLQAISAIDGEGERHLRMVLSNITERKRVEAALTDSEQRYRTLVEWTPEPLIVYRDGIILFVNPAAMKLFGAGAPSELVGSSVFDRVPPESRQAQVSRIRDLADHGQGSPLAVQQLLRMDGSVIEVEVQGTVISFGGLPSRQVSMRDVTGRKQIEAALQESEQRYRTLVEWMPEPILVLVQNRILYANPEAVKMFGASSVSEVVGTLVLDWVHPDEHQTVWQRRMTHPLDSPTIEQKAIRLDGSIINIEVQGTAISYNGEAARLVTMRDITQRKQAEAALIDSEQRYRTLVEWTPEPLVVHLGDQVLYVNPAAVKMFGAESASDLIKRPVLDWVHPDYHQVLFQRRATYALDSPVVEQKMLRLDGSVFDVEVQGTAISFDGKPARHTSIRDITERKKVEATLEAARLKSENASQAKSRFLASASHDLRQPAHALGLFVERLSEWPNLVDDASMQHLVGCMDASVRAMQDMLDGFFDISRLDSEPAQIPRVHFPIAGILDQLRNGLSAAASDKGLRLRVRPSSAWVESDPRLLHRILLNLVNNAVRYTQQGSVLVACRPTHDGSQLRIEVRDSGIGIASQHHEEIFQEFFQIDNPQRDRSKGLGVGLNIVERACRLLSHGLAIRSAPGRGTCFTLTVPLAPARVGAAAQDIREVGMQTGFDGLRVMLIEDDELGRVGLAGLLTSWGCRVTQAQGAIEAFELYRSDQGPDIIISDFRLGGGINGIEAVARLRTIAGRPIKACLISGDTDAGLKDQAQAVGLVLLPKPVRPAKMRSLLRHLAQQSSVVL